MKHLTWQAVCLAAAFSGSTLALYTSLILNGLSQSYLQSRLCEIVGIYQWCNRISFGCWFYCTKLKKITGLGSATFLVCVYPANIYMWIYDLELGDGSSLTTEGHIIRFFMQVFGVLLSLWVWKFRTQDH